METHLPYTKQFYLLLLLVFNIHFLNAQQSNSYSILLTGNTSKLNDGKLLKEWQQLSTNSDSLAFLMLGNIYNPKENKFPDELFSGNSHPILLAPGKKEWDNGGSNGKEAIRILEKNLTKKYKGRFYMPNAACPTPVEVVLSEHLAVIIIDTYWWVHKYDRRYAKCGIETNGDILVMIEDAIRKHYPNKHVVLAGHNTLKSYGNSSGYFSLGQNIFEAPYTFYRKILGTRNDTQHPDYKEFRNAMRSIIKKYPDIIYVSAGDKNLQYFTSDSVHYIVSGSMEQTKFVKSKHIEFGSNENGFAKLNFSDDGTCELIFINSQDTLFRKNIYKRTFVDKIKQKEQFELHDSILIKASNRYNKSKHAYFWIGQNYRKIWDIPVTAPVFDITTEKGGLHIVKRGGGKQTRSLRLEDKNGRQYVLRSLEKNVEGFLPNDLKNTFAVDFVQDQISTSNPYGALVVKPLAEFAGILHTNPKLFYVMDDPNFGIYRRDMAGQLYLFEERPDGDRTDVKSFAYSKKIVSTTKMLEKTFDDENHFIDSDSYLRSRLFDIFINDWDRHEDQWRWASFKDGEKTIYKAIPRDRDQAFFLNEGLVNWLAARKWLSPRFQRFDDYTENVEGLSFNARYLDRNLLTQSDWEDWQRQIDSLKTRLTDEHIDRAVLQFPKEIQASCANQTASILKTRIDTLEQMGKQLYLSLAKEPNVTGTNKSDLFEIVVPNDTTLSITAYNWDNGNKGVKIFSRAFYATETKKIFVYGLDKNDRFVIKGSAKNKIDLIIIGGKGKNEIVYDGDKIPRFITIYDKKGTELSPKLKNRIISSYDKKELKYDREAFKYDVVSPALYTGYNEDDGIFLGGGPVINKFSRYRTQRYEILANYAFLTQAFNIHFDGKNTYPLKHIELSLVADIRSPNFVNNYFGMGNETKWLVEKSNKEYYHVRMSEYYVQTNFKKYLDKDEIHKAGIGLFYKYTDIEETPDRFISDFTQNGLEPSDLSPHAYAGVSLNYKLNNVHTYDVKKEEEFGGSHMFPTKGMQLKTDFSYFMGLNDVSQDFSKVSGEWASYISFSQRPRVVYAVRLGGEKLMGNYVFNEAAKLGQKGYLRGYRQTRFYGDASLYLNTEIRIRVNQISTYILNTTGGLFLFNDVGRVWLDGENSSLWHDGYGAGLWWSPFNMALVTVSYAGSRDDNLFNISVNYHF